MYCYLTDLNHFNFDQKISSYRLMTLPAFRMQSVSYFAIRVKLPDDIQYETITSYFQGKHIIADTALTFHDCQSDIIVRQNGKWAVRNDLRSKPIATWHEDLIASGRSLTGFYGYIDKRFKQRLIVRCKAV